MNTITEDYVSFEVAKLLKEKGYDESTFGYYVDDKNKLYFDRFSDKWNSRHGYIAAPTLQMEMKWLREVHDIFIQLCIIPSTTVTMDQNYYFIRIYIGRREKRIPDLYEKYFKTPEQACEAAIKYCLETLI